MRANLSAKNAGILGLKQMILGMNKMKTSYDIEEWVQKQLKHYREKKYKNTEYSKGFKDGVLLAFLKIETILEINKARERK